MKHTHLSLFSGIGGIDLAADWAGFETVAFVEQNAYCQKVLAKHWPGVQIYDDVSTFNASPYRGVGLVSGGFPCQDVSAAKPGALGIAGGRSGLCFELLRIVGECSPVFVLIENSPALRVRGADAIFLALEKLGYAAEAFVVGAAHAGATHFRARAFLVAHSDRIPQYEDCRAWATLHNTERNFPAPESGRPQFCAESCRFDWWRSEPDLVRVVPRLSKWVDTSLRALGNTVVPQQVYPILQAISDQLTLTKSLQVAS